MIAEQDTRPEGLTAWTELCGVVDRVRILLNRDIQEAAQLTLAENLVLCQVAMSPERHLRMADLANHLAIAKSAVTKTVDRLEERGLLRRERDPSDRRTVYAALTGEGEKAFRLAQPAYVDSVERHFASHLSASTIGDLHRLHRRIFGDSLASYLSPVASG